MMLNFTGIAIRPDNQDCFAEIEDIIGYTLEENGPDSGVDEVFQNPADKEICFIYFSEKGALAIVNEIKIARLFFRQPYFHAYFKIDETSKIFKLEFFGNEHYSNWLSLIEENGSKGFNESSDFDIDEIDIYNSDSLTTIKSAINFILEEDIWNNKHIAFKRFTKKSCFRRTFDGHTISAIYSENGKFLLPMYHHNDFGKVISLSHDLKESVELNFDIQDKSKTHFAGIHSYKDKYIGISVTDVGTQPTYPFTVRNVYLSIADKSGNLILKEYLCEGMGQMSSAIHDNYLIIVCAEYKGTNCMIRYNLEDNTFIRTTIDFYPSTSGQPNESIHCRLLLIMDRIWVLNRHNSDIFIMNPDMSSFRKKSVDYSRGQGDSFTAKDYWSINAFELKLNTPEIFEYENNKSVGVLYIGEEKRYRRFLHFRLIKLSDSGDRISEEFFALDLISVYYRLDVIAAENLIIVSVVYYKQDIGYLYIYNTEMQLIDRQDWDANWNVPIKICGDYLYIFYSNTVYRRKLLQNKQLHNSQE